MEEYKDYCYQDFEDEFGIRVANEYWERFNREKEKYPNGEGFKTDVTLQLVERIAREYHTDPETIFAVLINSKGTERFKYVTYYHNYPDNKHYIDSAQAIIRSARNIKAVERVEKKIKRKVEHKDNRKPVQQDMAKIKITEKGEEEPMAEEEQLGKSISEFINNYVDGDEDRFSKIFDDYADGKRVTQSISEELGCGWLRVKKYFDYTIALIKHLDHARGVELDEKIKNLTPPDGGVKDFLSFTDEYKKVIAGEQLARDVMDHLHITRQAYDNAVHMYSVSNGNESVAAREKIKKSEAAEFNRKVAPDVFERYLAGETQSNIGSYYNRSDGWASVIIKNYLDEHPERRDEFELRKQQNISRKNVSCSKKADDEIKEESAMEEAISTDEMDNANKESSDTQEEQIEISVKSAEVPNVNTIFEPDNTIEVNLYKGQANFCDGVNIFPSRMKFFNNMEEDDVKDFVKLFIYDHVKFDENVPKTDIILYVSSPADYKLVMPVIDVCSKMKVSLAVNEYDASNKRYKFVYSTGRPSKDDDSSIMFVGCNRVEGLGCTLEDIINADRLYEMKEVMYDSNGKETYVYKLLAVDSADYLRRVYASEVSNMILNNKDQISVSICECSIEDGKLVDGEQNESYSKM